MFSWFLVVVLSSDIFSPFQIKTQQIKETQKVVRTNETTMCPVCHKPLGDAVFARYPNGIVVHYKCYAKQKDRNVDPVTGARFDRRAPL